MPRKKSKSPFFCNVLKKVPPPSPLHHHHHYNHTQKCQKKPKIISVNLALDLIKETSFFNTRCANQWKFCEVKKNSHKNMVQQEKLPSMFAGSTGVELKSERRIEKISMAYNGVLTPQTKITSLKL